MRQSEPTCHGRIAAEAAATARRQEATATRPRCLVGAQPIEALKKLIDQELGKKKD